MPDTKSSAAVVIDTSHSPYARLHPVPVNAVTLSDAFWAPRLEINRTVTLPSQHRHLEEAGTIDNFRRASGRKDVPFQGGFPFMDSDLYKWLEAASWVLATCPDDAPLRAMTDSVIAEIAAAQRADGYLNTYHSRERAEERWTNLRDMHELYCAGHLFQAAVAHHRATGDTGLLAVATRFADYLCAFFGPSEAGKHPGACGHAEVEMALVELYRITGERQYLEQARYFLDARGASPSTLTKDGASNDFDRRYFQDHVPFRALSEVTGHAVRMVYLACGATDLSIETGDAALIDALGRQWGNMAERRMYITGGLGARHEGEAFGSDYELPSGRAYAETCAAIANVMWNQRLLHLTGEAKHADLMELALYNGVLSGLSLDGTEYFYVNPLADDGGHRRQPWFGCVCCPPNVARLLASLPGYFYSVSGDAVYVHLYATGTARVTLSDGAVATLTQKTNYPWEGDIEIVLGDVPKSLSGLFLRIPGWVDGAAITVNGVPRDSEVSPGRYVWIGEGLEAGAVIRVLLPMPVRRIESHPFVADTRGCVALMRGPLVYCIEQADHDADVRQFVLPGHSRLTEHVRPDLLGGIVTIQSKAAVIATDPDTWGDVLYRSTEALEDVRTPAQPTVLTAIPYYAWANREPGAMRVWIPVA